jgi:hypothetical protein
MGYPIQWYDSQIASVPDCPGAAQRVHRRYQFCDLSNDLSLMHDTVSTTDNDLRPTRGKVIALDGKKRGEKETKESIEEKGNHARIE